MIMKIRGRSFRISQVICLFLYYGFARFLPCSYGVGGKISKQIRYQLCKRIFKYCGKNVNVERLANFGSGLNVEIDDDSDLGINCLVPSDIIIGKHVMMAPNCYIFSQNHEVSRTDIPMNKQGFALKKKTIIEDDVWIGRNVTMTPGRYISKGSIIGTCCLLCKDFPEYSVVGGNPSMLIKSRK